jgi:transcriptional regulator with XRE-family HTH domain
MVQRESEPEEPYPVAGLIRAARRQADLSQRELARVAGVPASTVARVESAARQPSVELFARLIAAAGMYLVVVDPRGVTVHPMRDWDDWRDGAHRRYPSHLDTIVDPEPGEWWADVYGLARPPETFKRDRRLRDAMRRRSQWEVRVAKYRNAPEPPDPQWNRWWWRWQPPAEWP